MLHSFHAILSTYGLRLPNDPRGSWSDCVCKWVLLQFGPATKVSTRKSVAAAPHDRQQRLAAKSPLTYTEVRLNGRQAQAVGHGFSRAEVEAGYSVYACSILPQYVYLVPGPHQRDIDQIVRHLKSPATHQLVADLLHPLAKHRNEKGTSSSLWARKSWKVFIYSVEHMRLAIRYAEKNSLKDRKRRQKWSFVVPY